MFETISGHSNAPKPKRRSALATALGLHAAIIGGALLYAQMNQPAEGPLVPAPPSLVFPQRPPRGPVKTTSANTQPTHTTVTRHEKPFKPRANPIDPASVPIEPEQIAAPVAPENPGASDNGSPTHILGNGNGNGDAGSTDSSDTPPCPPGAVCTMIGSEQVLSFSSQMTRPRPNCEPPQPLAPQAARQFGIEGRVVVQYVIHADGRADHVNIMNSDAPPMYAEAVRAWLADCNFTPAQMNGAPQSVRMVQSFNFAVK